MKWKSLAALIGAAALLAGCGDGVRGTDPEPGSDTTATQDGGLKDGMINVQEAPGEPQQGGTLSFAGYTEPRGLDPTVAQAAGSNGGLEMNSIYDTLLRYDYEANEVVPQLADSYESNDDFTEFTVKLRPNVQFSDGTPLDADAVVYSMNRYGSTQTSPEGTLWKNSVASVTAADDTTVVITLNETFPGFVNMLATGPGMIVAESAGNGDSFKPVGAGPFTVKEIKPREQTVLVANENYWDGRPYLDELRFVYLGQPQNSIEAFMSGDVDSVMIREPQRLQRALDDERPAYIDMAAASTTVAFNGAEGRPGADQRVRRAFGLAVDPKLVFDRAFEGNGIPSNELFPAYSIWHADTGGIEHDPDEARKLLDEAKADGFDGKITIMALTQETALSAKAQLDAVGFDITVEQVRSASDLIQRSLSGDYDAMTWSINIRDNDPYAKFSAVMHSGGTQTYGMPTSPEMDALIDEFKAAADEDEAKDVMERLEQQYYHDLPFVSFGPFAEAISWDKDIHGVVGGASTMVYLGKAWRG